MSSTPGQTSPLHLAGMAVSMLGVLAVTFVLHVAVVSGLRYERSQTTAYADLRADLANAVVPVGQTFRDEFVAPGTAIAVLRIPALDLRTVVFEGTAPDVLMLGPGHRRDTVLPGQAGTSVIMGRRATYGGPFANIGRIHVGDEIFTVTGQGNSGAGKAARGAANLPSPSPPASPLADPSAVAPTVEHRYRVIAIRRAGDPVIPSVVGAGRLTLVTADGAALLPEDALRVDAELLDVAEPTPRRIGAPPLTPAEQPLGTDTDAWAPVVFCGQAFLFAALALTWARLRWGFWQAWIVGLPLLVWIGLETADQVARLLPNVI